MAQKQARALYAFEGDPSNGELTFGENDLLYIIRQDVGDGWWEAKNSIGEFGLVPESYVEIVESDPWEGAGNPPMGGDEVDYGFAGFAEPEEPPPPAPEAQPDLFDAFDAPLPEVHPPPQPIFELDSMLDQESTSAGNDWGQQDQWNGGGGSRHSYHAPPAQAQPSVEEWEDDWDDDDDQSSNSTGTNQVSNETPKPDSVGKATAQNTGSTKDLQGSGNFGLAAARREKGLPAPGDMSKYGTVKSSYSRFSQFAKSGGEAFLMGQVNANVAESDLIKILESQDGPVWQNSHSPYTCVVSSPKKESKMKGLKSFIIYQLTPSFSNIVVSRRYKHFDWLHERMVEKFPCIPIPPLPDKAISGRYEEDFIQERMRQLQLWVNRMVCHPVISQSEVFLHFLTCTDERKWKAGKRKAEKDEYQGGKFFLLLQTPPMALSMREVDGKMEMFCKFVMNFTENVKQMIGCVHDLAKRESGGYKREFQKFSACCKQMAITFNMDDRERSRALTSAVDYMGDAFKTMADLLEAQPKKDAVVLVEHLHEYKGILQTFPDVLKVHEGAMGKAKDCRNLQEQGKMSDSEVQAVSQRGDTISFAVMAEINHFQDHRVSDVSQMMRHYIGSRRELLEKFVEILKGVEDKYAAV